jgi:hypothetical protein
MKTNTSNDDGDDETGADDQAPAGQRTRSGRAVQPPRRLIDEIGAATMEQLTEPERRYYERMSELGLVGTDDYKQMTELGLVGAGIGGGFENTQELHVKKYNEAMKTPDKKKWQMAVDEEHERMNKYKVWKPVNKKDFRKGEKVLSTTWAMKKKSNGKYRARLNARGFAKIDGVHYDEDTESSPVVNEATILVVFVLRLLAGWSASIVDVNGAFVNGRFESRHKMYMDVAQGFEKHYDNGIVVLVLRTLHGTKQAALQFWRALIAAMQRMMYVRSQADPRLFYKRDKNKDLSIWTLWVDDLLNVGKPHVIAKAKEHIKKEFDCDDVSEMTEFIGCKIDLDRSAKTMRLTQPVLLQSFSDEFDIGQQKADVPAKAGSMLSNTASDTKYLSPEKQREFRSGDGKLLHLAKWSRPEIKNAVRELTRGMTQATDEAYKSMQRVMKHCVETPNRGLLLAPTGSWSGDPNDELIIKGMSNTTYASDHDTRRNVMGRTTFLNDAPVIVKSNTGRIVDLSVTESEFGGATETAQDKGAKDLINNWSVGGRTCHMEVREYFLRELKEQGLICCVWTAGTGM